MSRATRRRIAAAPIAAPAPLARPSGRFDAFVDMGNPMKGINLFPYLRRRVEGRALGALGPTAVLELSRTVREAALPRRWPREVVHDFSSFTCRFCYQGVSYLFIFHHVSFKGSGSALSHRRAINPTNLTSHVAWR